MQEAEPRETPRFGTTGAGVAAVAQIDASEARNRCVPPGLGDRDAATLVRALVTALWLRDRETAEHSVAVAELGVRIGRSLRLSSAALEDLHLAAVAHDVGKLGVPDAILAKPGPLDASEWDVIHLHPGWGEELLFESPSLARVARIVGASHERWDGSGYPDGLSGPAIPIEARVIAVCDTFDALTSERPYQAPVGVEAAVEEIRSSAGSHFDPRIVDAFCGVDSLEAYARGAREVAA